MSRVFIKRSSFGTPSGSAAISSHHLAWVQCQKNSSFLEPEASSRYNTFLECPSSSMLGCIALVWGTNQRFGWPRECQMSLQNLGRPITSQCGPQPFHDRSTNHVLISRSCRPQALCHIKIGGWWGYFASANPTTFYWPKLEPRGFGARTRWLGNKRGWS